MKLAPAFLELQGLVQRRKAGFLAWLAEAAAREPLMAP